MLPKTYPQCPKCYETYHIHVTDREEMSARYKCDCGCAWWVNYEIVGIEIDED